MPEERKKIIIVGTPNVGKSALFNSFTGTYVTVSNYPDTTVEISRGRVRIEGRTFELVDTPGLYSFLPLSEEERVSLRILREEKPFRVIHIVDAKNIGRMLPLTFGLMEAGLPVILVLNLMDEAEERGIKIDPKVLEEELGIPAVSTVATEGRGGET